MNMPGSLFLTGPMGAGKSTIGRQLAKQLRLPFHDSDHEIESRTGVDIPLIFELEGEAGFRKREASVIDELTRLPNIVLATGGGAVMDPANRQHLKTRGRVIYLHTSVNHQLKRTRKDRKRPLLQTGNPREKLDELMSIRDPLYRELASIIIDTNGMRVRDVVKIIMQRLTPSTPSR
jgi:shikimate kinase